YCILFSSLVRSPPSPTLFPYTTLFRSQCRVRPPATRPAEIFHDEIGLGRKAGHRERPGRVSSDARPGDHDSQDENLEVPPATCQDRKSTRLNSSHLGISYAVFCLKKKK